MRLKSFTVEGFKNLTGPVTFGPLQSVNVLHGANNAGKTNVLQAMDAFFRLLRAGNQVTKDQMVSLEPAGRPAGYPFEEIFNQRSPEPIRWWVELSIEREELEEVGIEANFDTEHVAITLELSPGLGGAQLRVLHFHIGEVDAAGKDPERDSPLVGFAQQLRAHIARTYALETERLGNPFVLLDVAARAPEDGGLVPQALRDELFDARQSLDHDDRRRWSLFVRLARELEPELGRGQFDTAFDRKSGRANLIYDTGETALPVDRLGSGIQRFVALLASLVLTRAVFVALEEPELHLSYSLQARLRRVLQAVADGGGPRQFFVSSHSTALDDAENCFVLELIDGAPVIEQRPWTEAGMPPPPPQETAREFGDSLASAETVPAPAPEAAAPPDLDDLIGLVDQLSELDPQEILAGEAAASGGKPAAEPARPAAAAGAAAGGAKDSRVVDAAPWRLPNSKR